MQVSRIMPKYSRLSTFGIAILSVGYFLEPDLSEAETNAEYPRTLNSLVGLEGSELSLGGFVDTYLAFDLNDPNRRRRDYLTLPSRNEEPNVNLAFLDAKWSTDVSRGRVAVQAGTSVDANYTSEPE
ncbi:MAG: outer membrane beta-barrel protein, partial [Deltaproteobacteria bacterium]|nr:outer membrane beta-barrel protein [Deltaproteobacteria bacterium]